MIGVREHINGLDGFDAVAVAGEVFQIAGQSLGVAGDINDTLWREGDGGRKESLIAAGAGRIHEQNVTGFALGGHVNHEVTCVGTDEADVLHAVQLGVGDRIMHGVPVDLNAQHLPGSFSGNHADGANAAVCVDDRFPAGKSGEFHGLTVEHFGLHRVDLIK